MLFTSAEKVTVGLAQTLTALAATLSPVINDSVPCVLDLASIHYI